MDRCLCGHQERMEHPPDGVGIRIARVEQTQQKAAEGPRGDEGKREVEVETS